METKVRKPNGYWTYKASLKNKWLNNFFKKQ